MSRVSRWLAIVGLVLILGVANTTIWQRQQIVDHGQLLLLELRPVDPRSLMQGDFMMLRYAEAAFPPAGMREQLPNRGVLVLQLGENNVATYARIEDGSPIAGNEQRLRYKQVDEDGEIRLGAESFFFEEGQAEKFAAARFGMLRADADGRSVLVGLADEQQQPIQ